MSAQLPLAPWPGASTVFFGSVLSLSTVSNSLVSYWQITGAETGFELQYLYSNTVVNTDRTVGSGVVAAK